MNRLKTISILFPTAATTNSSQLISSLVNLEAIDKVSTVWLRDLPAIDRNSPDKGPGIDPFVLAANALSAVSSGHKLGVAVAPAGARHFAALARTASSICDIANTQFRLGIGSGEPSSPWSLAHSNPQRKQELLIEYINNLYDLLEDSPSSSLELSRPYSTGHSPRIWIATSALHVVKALGSKLEGWMTWQSQPGFIQSSIQELETLELRPRVATTVNVCFTRQGNGIKHLSMPVPAIHGAPHVIASYIEAHFELGIDEVIINPCILTSEASEVPQLSLLEECISHIDLGEMR